MRHAAKKTGTAVEPIEQSFWIGNSLVEPRLNQVTTHGKTQHVEHRVMRVLTLLAACPGEPVSREEILDIVWAGTTPNDEGLTQAICKLRKILGDQPDDSEVIQTIRKIGYRLLAPVSFEPGSSRTKTHVFDLSRSDQIPSRHIRIRLNGRWALTAAVLLLTVIVIAIAV